METQQNSDELSGIAKSLTSPKHVRIAVAFFWIVTITMLAIWALGDKRYAYIQTIVLVLTLLGVVWYAELTRRIYGQIRRQTRVSTDSYRIHATSVSAEWILKLEDRFESPEYVRNRVIAANFLLKGEVCAELKRVWDFFETVGLLTKTDILNERMVWNTFFTWLNGYMQASSALLKNEQKADPLLWEHVDYLYRRGCECELIQYPASEQLALSDKQIERFLQEETALLEASLVTF